MVGCSGVQVLTFDEPDAAVAELDAGAEEARPRGPDLPTRDAAPTLDAAEPARDAAPLGDSATTDAADASQAPDAADTSPPPVDAGPPDACPEQLTFTRWQIQPGECLTVNLGFCARPSVSGGMDCTTIAQCGSCQTTCVPTGASWTYVAYTSDQGPVFRSVNPAAVWCQ